MAFSFKIVVLVLLGATIVCVASPSNAQSSELDIGEPQNLSGAFTAVSGPPVVIEEEAREKPRTTIEITPYVWASAFGGTIRPGPDAPTVQVDVKLGDLLKIWKHVDAVTFLGGSIEHDRFVMMADLTHATLSRDGRIVTAHPLLPDPAAGARIRKTSVTGLIGYRAVDKDATTLDLLIGARGWWIRPEATVPALDIVKATKVRIIDPVVAARVRINPASD